MKHVIRATFLALLSTVLLFAGVSGAAQATPPAASSVISSPYDGANASWLRGNLHTHTKNSDGNRPPQEVVDQYAKLKYDFLMLSDHDQITDPAKLDARGMTLIAGNEITAKGPHLLHVGAHALLAPDPDRQAVLDKVQADGGFAIMNHPNWGPEFNHCDFSVLDKLQGYAGMEIFNGVVLYGAGNQDATDKWDRLLSKGRKVWGFATDDRHADEHAGLGWVMVQSKSHKAEDIVEAIRQGRFYASTGVRLKKIQVEENTVLVTSANAQHYRVCADSGAVLKCIDGKKMQFTVNPAGKYTYIRIEAYGPGAAQAWTQPFFITK